MLVHLPGLTFGSTLALCGVTETETEAAMASSHLCPNMFIGASCSQPVATTNSLSLPHLSLPLSHLPLLPSLPSCLPLSLVAVSYLHLSCFM
jgi:hypothetical protein